MSTHIRNRRKKYFKTNEVREIEQPSGTAHAINKRGEETSTLNIRRSSRKPKPKKHDDDYVSTEQELAEQVIEGEDVASLKPDGQESTRSSGARSGVFSGSGVRRETRKTYQHYLETLGYHADFSKISSLESVQHPGKGKLGFGQRNTVKQLKSKDNPIAKLLFPSNSKSEKTVLAKETSTKVRTSSRTPKPRRTFSLLEDNSHTNSDSILQNVSDSVETLETKIKSSKTDKGKKAPSENQGHNQFKGQRHMASSMAEDSSMTKPLSKQDVDEGHEADVLSDADDSSQTRTSTRVRIPKRKFSLIEPSPSMHEAKRLKLMSEQHTSDGEVCEDEGLDDKVPDDGKLQTRSTLVIKRFGGRKQQGNRRGNLRGNTVETDKQKGGDLSKKVDQSRSGSEKKSEGQRGRQKIEEPIVSKLKISKDITVVKDSKKPKRDKEDEEKTSRKLSKRKRGNSDLEKSASEKDEKDIKNDNKEHIVLKLTIPHESPKTEEKGHEKHHHKHHHHHKHKKEKKESESDTQKKKNKSDVEILDASKSKETSDKDFGVMETVTNVKKKKKKSKEESISESLSSDNSALPHVKLVIKKSPVKPKDKKEAVKNDHPKITKLSSQTSDEQNNQSDKPNAKVKSNKPTSKIKKKIIKKDIKVKAVSAYSLFTKSRRKNLLEREPNLDFANTSRRLADMWKELTLEDKEFWRLKAQAIRKSNKQKACLKGYKGNNLSRKGRTDSDSASKESDTFPSSGTDAVDMAAYLKLLGESLCSIGMCLKRQDQMEVHGSLSVLLDTALCSIVPLFCLTSQLPEMAGCPPTTQAQILDNLAYIIPGL